MATPVPAPVLDNRNGDQVVAASIGSLPSELSDRSDSNAAVVVLEAAGSQYDKLIYQLNRWPPAVIQKALSLIGVTLNPATAATVIQTFTLSNPQATDTTIARGAQVSTTDGSLVFASGADLTIKAYTTPAGTITITSGSTAVTGSGTTFVTDGTWNGWQIQGANGAWYTISSVTNATALVLTTSATVTQSVVSFNVGPVSGTVSVACTTTGLATNVAAGKLTTLVSSPIGVASTTNAAATTGGADLEGVASAISRAPLAFASRDICVTASDYAYAAGQVLGQNARVQARAAYNGNAAASGYVTTAMLSPNWTTTAALSAQEIAAVGRDQSGRTLQGTTSVLLAVNIQTFTSSPNLPAAIVWRQSTTDPTTAKVNVATAINNYLTPASYPWAPAAYPSGSRAIQVTDLSKVIGNASGIDRVHEINGVMACGMNWQTTANNIVFTNGSSSATANAGDIASLKLTINQSFLIDPNSGSVTAYLVTNISGTTLTLDRTFAGSTITGLTNYFNSADVALLNWYSLPYANLSIDPTAPPVSVVVTGSV